MDFYLLKNYIYLLYSNSKAAIHCTTYLKRYEEANEDYEKSIELVSNNLKELFNMVVSYLKFRKYKLAFKTFYRFIKGVLSMRIF